MEKLVKCSTSLDSVGVSWYNMVAEKSTISVRFIIICSEKYKDFLIGPNEQYSGYTKKTGRCLVSAATRNHFQVIAVTLNAPDDWNDHINMLNYAFENYTAKPLVLKDMVIKTVPVKNGDAQEIELLSDGEFYLPFQEQDGLEKMRLEYDIPGEIPAPVRIGTTLGRLKIYYEESMVGEIELRAGTDIRYVEPPKGILDYIKEFFSIWFKKQ